MTGIYFETGDCRRTHSAAGINFNFTKWGMLGGSPQGVYKAQSMQEAAALATIASDAKSGVWEIDQTTYERRLGIKEVTQPMNWNTFDSSTPANSGGVPVPNPAAERIKATVDRSLIPPVENKEKPAEVVEVQPLDSADAPKVGKTEVIVSPPPPQPARKSSKDKSEK
jgi:hypothetical protein